MRTLTFSGHEPPKGAETSLYWPLYADRKELQKKRNVMRGSRLLAVARTPK